MIHHEFYVINNYFCDEFVSGLEIDFERTSSYNVTNDEDVHIWMEGEIYKQDELIDNSNDRLSDKDLLKYLYKNDNSLSFLAKIDGFFAPTIYDSKQKVLHLVSDRYGLRHLYYMIHKGCLYFASEVKAMIGINGYVPEIDQLTLKSFLALGYPLENRTWFREVSFLPTGTVLTWGLNKAKCRLKRYCGGVT